MVAAALVVAVPLWTARGRSRRPGDVVTAPISLVTADRDELECAYPRTIEGYRCAFVAPDEAATPPPEPRAKLAPYVTSDRMVLLVPGLFLHPALAARVAAEPPEDRVRSTLRRFEARCQVRLLERVTDARLRFGPQFGAPEPAWIAEPIDCRVIEGR
jgi:hypothetical protein